MKNKVVIIGNGNIGRYLEFKLSNSFNVVKIPARSIKYKSSYNLDKSDTLVSLFDILDILKNGGHIIYAGKYGKLLDYIVVYIQKYGEEFQNNFYIFGVNGAKEYGNISRLVLNSAIKKDQLDGKLPSKFGESVLYHLCPTTFEVDLFGNLGLDIKITDDKLYFLKVFYLKLCVSTIINSISILYNSSIRSSINKFETDNQILILSLIKELYLIINNIHSKLLTQLEIEESISLVINEIPNVYPSSTSQFWIEKEGVLVSDYNNSDVGITLEWVVIYGKEKLLDIPNLLFLLNKIKKL